MSYKDKRKRNLWEKFYPLDKDPALANARVMIGARVEYDGLYGQKHVSQRIVFRREMPNGRPLRAAVKCVHLAVVDLRATVADDGRSIEVDELLSEEEAVEIARTTEGERIELAPEEHFKALKSYVQGIAEMGIANLMTASYWDEDINPETLPFGFNAAMHSQVARCLARVCPIEALDLLESLFRNLRTTVPPEWLSARVDVIKEMYHLDHLRGRVKRQRNENSTRYLLDAYGRDYHLGKAFMAMDLVSGIRSDGKFDFRNRRVGLYPGMPGYPVSHSYTGAVVGIRHADGSVAEYPDGWKVVCDRWTKYETPRLPVDGVIYWADWPEPWRAKVAQLAAQGEEDQVRCIRVVVEKRDGGSRFYESLFNQLRAWIYDPAPRFRRPFSRKQRAAVMNPRY